MRVGNLRRVLTIRHQIVEPEALDGDEGMLVRTGSAATPPGTWSVTVLVSSAVPAARRPQVVSRMLRAVKRERVANDLDAPESRTLTA